MTDLLARLKSPGVKVTSREITPAKLEALIHMYDGQKLVLKRKRGEDLPPAWEHVQELEEIGLVRAHAVEIEDNTRYYGFSITAKGREEARKAGHHVGK